MHNNTRACVHMHLPPQSPYTSNCSCCMSQSQALCFDVSRLADALMMCALVCAVLLYCVYTLILAKLPIWVQLLGTSDDSSIPTT
jgi:hypothetical protein